MKRLIVALLLVSCSHADLSHISYATPRIAKPTPRPKLLTFSQLMTRLQAYCAALTPTSRGHYKLSWVDPTGTSDQAFACATDNDSNLDDDSIMIYMTPEMLRQ